jgi:hypothetical protein
MTIELTEQEFREVVKEITERIKDMIYMNLERRVEETLRALLKGHPKSDDPIEIKWKMSFVFGDIEQIVGRLRRERSERA